MRSDAVFPAVRTALSAASGAGFRLLHFSVQVDHVHLIVEADSRERLIRGVQGLAVRCARAINRAAGRRGRVWSERYHAHALATPTETRRGLAYVLLNHRKHLRAAPGIDARSSGAWFDGWTRPVRRPLESPPVCPPASWLASTGWRRAGGPIDWSEAPARPVASDRRRKSGSRNESLPSQVGRPARLPQ